MSSYSIPLQRENPFRNYWKNGRGDLGYLVDLFCVKVGKKCPKNNMPTIWLYIDEKECFSTKSDAIVVQVHFFVRHSFVAWRTFDAQAISFVP